MRPMTLVLTIQDGKTAQSQMLINLPSQADNVNIYEQIEAAIQHQIDVDAVTTGQIVRCGLILDIPLDASLKNAPDPDSDVEEGALFEFSSINGFLSKVRIPTFDESKTVSGTAEVNLADPAVQDMVTSILNGLETSFAYIHAQDSRGDDLVALNVALKSFQRSRASWNI